MMDALSFVGLSAVAVASVTGGYVWLRWGYRGVVAIWKSRRTLDASVEQEVTRLMEFDSLGK